MLNSLCSAPAARAGLWGEWGRGLALSLRTSKAAPLGPLCSSSVQGCTGAESPGSRKQL